MFSRIRSLPVARDRQHRVLEVLAEAKDHGPAGDEVRVQHQAERFQPANSNVRQDQQARGDHSVYEQFGVTKTASISSSPSLSDPTRSPPRTATTFTTITTTIIGTRSLRFHFSYPRDSIVKNSICIRKYCGNNR